jgi:hypothetical protein
MSGAIDIGEENYEPTAEELEIECKFVICYFTRLFINERI